MFKYYRLITLFLVLTLSIQSKCQKLLYSTPSTFSFDMNVGKHRVDCTLGETMTGVKKGNGYTVIEGFYSVFDFNTTGTLVPQTGTYKIFPNPASDFFFIYNENNNIRLISNIYTLEGIKIKSILVSTNTKVQVNDLPDGIYLIETESEYKSKIWERPIKLIIKHQ